MTWTTVADLRAQVQKLWDKGALLAPLVSPLPAPLTAPLTAPHPAPLFPRRLKLTGPSSSELTDRFDEARAWMAKIRQPHLWRIVERDVRHRVLGNNAVPDEVWIDSLEAALAVIGKTKEAKRFADLLAATQQRQPSLLAWLSKRPLSALALAAEWARLLQVVAWLQAHPRPGIYLRQVDIPGVDSKFIEAHKGVLCELLDLALPPEAIDQSAAGVSQFCRRYGFQDKPLRIRFRLLDSALALWPSGVRQDIAITQDDFERLDLPLHRVFITENEVNFLAFPEVAGSLVIFGAGYGFDVLSRARWLHALPVHYWGDIDTHGFAILDQLRVYLPQTQSLLMDRATLLAHSAHWGLEPQPLLRDLPRLTQDEAALFDDLRSERLGTRVRLEQERIGYEQVKLALAELQT